jgi:hypothetical protein
MCDATNTREQIVEGMGVRVDNRNKLRKRRDVAANGFDPEE